MNHISQYFGKNPNKRDLSDDSKTGDGDSKKHEKVVQEVLLRKLMFLRKEVSQLTVEKFYLTV